MVLSGLPQIKGYFPPYTTSVQRKPRFVNTKESRKKMTILVVW